ncbi:MAG: hypothetical protein ACI9R3_001131 [Verrucomicrobiales bacterium]|jgi:hypothetical protein
MNAALKPWAVESPQIKVDGAARHTIGFRFSSIVLLLGVLSLLYTGICFISYSSVPSADEAWYHVTATQFANGSFFDLSGGEIVAPGYPLFLAGLVTIGIPLWGLKAVNVLLLTGGLWFFYKAARLFVSERVSLITVAVLGLHPLLLRWVSFLMTESLSFFCMTGFLFCFCSLLRRKNFSVWALLCATAFFALLCLTRSLFAYAAIVGILACVVLGCIHLRNENALPFWRAGSVLVLALLMCVPYLLGTFAQTGKAFYWSSYGGGLLYWISSPYEDERGDWHSIEDVRENPILVARHLEFLTATEALPLLKREAVYQSKAFENIRQNPAKLIRNWVDNTSRLLFGTPRSFKNERVKTHVYIWPHVCVMLLCALSVLVVARRWRDVPPAMPILALLALTYFGGSMVLPAMPRFLVPILPIVALWLAFVFSRLVHFRLVPAPTPDGIEIQ